MAEHPIIKLGSSGPAVKLAQGALICRGYLMKGDDDGIFGYRTDNAVRRYQFDRSTGQFNAFSFPLKSDGVVGELTWGRLDPPEIKKGAKGHAVRLLQEVLKHFGSSSYNPGNIDGDFGPLTEAAVKAFQTDYSDCDGNPLKVDGIVGHKTWAALWS